MNKRQIQRAAKIWAAALAYHTGCDGSDPFCDLIRTEAIQQALATLDKLGVTPQEVLCESDALSCCGVDIDRELKKL